MIFSQLFIFNEKSTNNSGRMSHCQMHLPREQGLCLSDFYVLGTYHPAGHNVFVVLIVINDNIFLMFLTRFLMTFLFLPPPLNRVEDILSSLCFKLMQ